MRYISTRGQAPPVSFLDAVLAGMAPDGGLYVPEEWPDSSRASLGGGDAAYDFVAWRMLQAFAGEPLFKDSDLLPLVANYKTAFASAAVTPAVQYGPGQWLLELFHGPSLSFKDIAMQLIGPLYDHALESRNARLSVVCATSGDTGGAAVEALKGRERVDVFVLLPKDRVSSVQRRFMTTSGATNVHAVDIEGDFDVCQALVKALFADQEFAARASLSGVNSINFARIVAQAVYFYVAAQALQGDRRYVNISVPTGNFGDAYSAFVAKKMGAPIGVILLATNANDILARARLTGRYQRAAASAATLSPAMDIQVASNFERIVFEATGRDANRLRGLYDRFAQSGGFDLPDDAQWFLREHFFALSVDDDTTLEEMRRQWRAGDGRLVCPHTAIGMHAARYALDLPHEEVTGDSDTWETAIISLATAHPAKFPETVERATGVRPQLPPKCADLFSRPEKFDSLAADVEAVKQYIRERSRAWS